MASAWFVLLQAQHIDMSLLRTVRIYLIGLFFAAFTPAGLGGDVIRIQQLRVDTSQISRSIASNIALRLLSLTALLSIGSAAYFFNHDLPGARLSILVFLATIMGFISIFSLENFVKRLLNLLPWPKIALRIESLTEALFLFKQHLCAMTGASILLVIAQIFAAMSAYPIAQGLHANIPFYWFLAVIPIARLAAFLPITPNGIGVYEGVSVLMFVKLGVEPQVAFAFTLLDDVILTATSLAGGPVYLLSSRR